MTLFDGIASRVIETPRLNVSILERAGDDPGTAPEQTVVLVHGDASSSLFWQELMQDLPSDLRVVAIDLRGHGATDPAPIDATRGVRDFSDDVRATLAELDIPTAHFVGWSLGAGVVLQYALDHATLSLTLESPVSPYGFGGAGTGGGAGDLDDTSAATHFDVSGIVDLALKPPIAWIHGTADLIVSDASPHDLDRLGALGFVPGRPGADVAPPQETASQTRDVLEAYRAAGGEVTELALEGAGHAPHLERPAEFRRALLTVMGYVGPRQDPAPPTETIILRASD